MTGARLRAFQKLWAASENRPCRANRLGPRKATLDAMRDDGLVRVVNRGYVLTKNGHDVATELMKSGWKAA